MGALHATLTTVTAVLDAALGAEVNVQQHPGRFTERELGQVVLQRKAVRVAIEAIDKVEVQGNGTMQAVLRYNALVIAGDTTGEDRHETAIDIVEAIAKLLPFQRWGKPENFKAISPGAIEIQNLYSGEVNGKGIAWWAATWTQAIKTN